MIKLGQSSRTFILGGPQDLMPEEGLSRQQRKALAAMEVSCSTCKSRHWFSMRAAGSRAASRAPAGRFVHEGSWEN